jgi:hypothetical protein
MISRDPIRNVLPLSGAPRPQARWCFVKSRPKAPAKNEDQTNVGGFR